MSNGNFMDVYNNGLAKQSISSPTIDNTGMFDGLFGNMSFGDAVKGFGLGLEAYNTFGPDGRALTDMTLQGIDARTKLANQQVKANKQAMADRKQFNNTWANASNGLAASYANKVG